MRHARCINPKHLQIGTQQQNVRDMHARGRASKRTGESNNAAKVSEDVVAIIRTKRSAGASLKQLADEFNLSQSQISNITTYKQWKEEAS